MQEATSGQQGGRCLHYLRSLRQGRRYHRSREAESQDMAVAKDITLVRAQELRGQRGGAGLSRSELDALLLQVLSTAASLDFVRD